MGRAIVSLKSLEEALFQVSLITSGRSLAPGNIAMSQSSHDIFPECLSVSKFSLVIRILLMLY